MSSFSISVVIPNYNGRKLLEDNLPSVFEALANAKTDYEVIVSDDASTDESVEFLKKNYPQVIVIKNEINKGFSPTINRGIRKATKDLVFALNSDVKLTPGYFLPQFKYFEDPSTFGVMGRIIGLDNDVIQDGAKYPSFSWFKIGSTTNFLPESAPQGFKTPTLFLSGANALVDRKKIMELGGFDEIYRPFYGEDVDLSLRAWRLGWNCYYEDTSICRHPNSVTIKNYHKEERVKAISFCNRLVMHSIHLKGMHKALWSIINGFKVLVSWITFKRYVYKGLSLYFDKSIEIKQSRERFDLLLKKYPNNQDVASVIKGIQKRIENLSIKKF